MKILPLLEKMNSLNKEILDFNNQLTLKENIKTNKMIEEKNNAKNLTVSLKNKYISMYQNSLNKIDSLLKKIKTLGINVNYSSYIRETYLNLDIKEKEALFLKINEKIKALALSLNNFIFKEKPIQYEFNNEEVVINNKIYHASNCLDFKKDDFEGDNDYKNQLNDLCYYLNYLKKLTEQLILYYSSIGYEKIINQKAKNIYKKREKEIIKEEKSLIENLEQEKNFEGIIKKVNDLIDECQNLLIPYKFEKKYILLGTISIPWNDYNFFHQKFKDKIDKYFKVPFFQDMINAPILFLTYKTLNSFVKKCTYYLIENYINFFTYEKIKLIFIDDEDKSLAFKKLFSLEKFKEEKMLYNKNIDVDKDNINQTFERLFKDKNKIIANLNLTSYKDFYDYMEKQKNNNEFFHLIVFKNFDNVRSNILYKKLMDLIDNGGKNGFAFLLISQKPSYNMKYSQKERLSYLNPNTIILDIDNNNKIYINEIEFNFLIDIKTYEPLSLTYFN